VNLASVETPAAVVDLSLVGANISRVVDYCRSHGIGWRPHVKTHKNRRLAQMQLDAGAIGLTVATPHEARVMSAVTDDLLLAYPPVGRVKIRRLMDLPEQVRLSVALDSVAVLEPLAKAAQQAGKTVGVLVELDVGAKRVGVSSAAEAIGIARLAAELEGVEYRGIAFYPGHIRSPQTEQGPALAQLSQVLADYLGSLGEADLEPRVVSGGSTPTLFRSHELPQLTEIRPGTCIFYDRDIAGMGVTTWNDLAYTVLATVVSVAVPGRAAIDAGSKALSKEAFRSSGDGYGVLLEHPEVVVASLSEEHGVLDITNTTWRPKVGERVRVVPNHVCVSVNLQDRLLVEEEGRLEAWAIDGRGRGLAPTSPVGV